MNQLDKESLNVVRTWLSNRQGPNDEIDHYQTNVLIHPNDRLRLIGFPDLHLRRYSSPQLKPIAPIELHQLLKWMLELVRLLRANKTELETMEFIRNGFNRPLAEFRVQEAIGIVQGALCCDLALELESSCSRSPEFVLVEESSGAIDDILLRICVCLLSFRPVVLISKVTSYNTSLLAAFLVDLMHEAGASAEQVQLLVQDIRRNETSFTEGAFSWRLSPASRKLTKLSSVAICFADADISVAINSILKSYLQLQTLNRNLIVLVEESIYEQFLRLWQSQFPDMTQQSSENSAAGNGEIQVDLNSIDMSLAHRMVGRCINVIRFRSTEELCKLLNKLRKIPQAQVWTSQCLFGRQFCLAPNQLNNCAEFWLNHLPPSLTGRKFHEFLIKYHRDSVKNHMDTIYSNVLPDYEEEIERLRKLQATFVRKRDFNQRSSQILFTYLSLIHKFRSMKPAQLTLHESLIRMKKFQLLCSNQLSELMTHEPQIETQLKPIGLAILVASDKSCVKSKSVLIDFIFKNLLLGNGVLLICPQTLLGVRFPASLMNQQDNLPFLVLEPKWADSTPSEQEYESDLSSSWDSSQHSDSNSSSPIKLTRPQLKCPKSIYAIEFDKNDEVEGERVNGLVLALGVKRRTVWHPDGYLWSTQNSNDPEQQQQKQEIESDSS